MTAPQTPAAVHGGEAVTAAGQLTLDLAPLVTPLYEPEATIAERYDAWKAANPWVLPTVERLAAQWFAAGHKRVGVKALWEVLRWEYGTTTGDKFKANNDFTSRVARDLITRRPDWADCIEIRELRAA